MEILLSPTMYFSLHGLKKLLKVFFTMNLHEPNRQGGHTLFESAPDFGVHLSDDNELLHLLPAGASFQGYFYYIQKDNEAWFTYARNPRYRFRDTRIKALSSAQSGYPVRAVLQVLGRYVHSVAEEGLKLRSILAICRAITRT